MDREDEPVLVYGIYPGVARKDGLTAVCHYDYERFRQVFGADLDAYLDFLIEQDEAASATSRPNRVVRVPFDAEDFSRWRAQNETWGDNPDGHSAWALSIAEDPGRLRALRQRCPLLTRVPSEEKTAVTTMYLTLLTMYEMHQDTGPVTRALSAPVLSELREALARGTGDLPSFTPVSRLRSEGLVAIPGNRMVDPDRAQDAADMLDEQVLREVRARGAAPEVVNVPRSLRLRLDPDRDELEPVILLLPVVLLGAAELVAYVEHKWAAEPGPLTDSTAQLLYRRLRLPDPPPGIRYEAAFLPSDMVEEFLDTIDEQLDDLYLIDDPDDDDPDADLFDDEDDLDDEGGDYPGDDPDGPPNGNPPRPPHLGARSTPRAIRHIRRIK